MAMFTSVLEHENIGEQRSFSQLKKKIKKLKKVLFFLHVF
jgi:hypothetical protein